MIHVPGDSPDTGGDLAPLKGHPHRLGSCATELAAGRLSGLIVASLPQCSEEFRRRSRPKREVIARPGNRCFVTANGTVVVPAWLAPARPTRLSSWPSVPARPGTGCLYRPRNRPAG